MRGAEANSARRAWIAGWAATGGTAALIGTNYGGSMTVAAGGQLTLTGSSNWATTYSGTADIFRLNGTMNLNSDGVNAARFTNAQILATSTTGRLNFDGGILRAGRSSTTFLQGLGGSQINARGATIDTQGFDVTVGQSLEAPTGDGLTSVAITGRPTAIASIMAWGWPS